MGILHEDEKRGLGAEFALVSLAGEEFEAIADFEGQALVGFHGEAADFVFDEFFDFDTLLLDAFDFSFTEDFGAVLDADKEFGDEFAFEHLAASDELGFGDAEHAHNFHFALSGFDDFFAKEALHAGTGVVEKFVDDAVVADGDAVAGGEFGDVGGDADVEAIDDGILVAGGHVDVVLGDVADAGSDDVEGDLALGVNELE